MKIVLQQVVKRFYDRDGREQTVLDDVSFSCASGSVTVLEGRSGSGKSTLLNLISGLLVPDGGSVTVGGEPLSQLSEARRDRFRSAHIGYVFQTFNLLTPLSALENLVVPAALAGNRGAADEERARGILERLGLAEHLDKRPFELSVGQRQRVAVARAVLSEPAVLLADEPTANLDRESAEAVTSALAGLNDRGTTLVLASHDADLKAAFDAAVFDVEAAGADG